MAKGRLRQARRLLGRALLRHCPNCGGSGIFTSWFRLLSTCPTCGLPLERGEQGYVVGAYMFNIAVAELGFAGLFIGGLVLTWPNPPWTLLTYASAALVVILPVVFYPFSKTLFLGLHLLFNPAEPSSDPRILGTKQS